MPVEGITICGGGAEVGTVDGIMMGIGVGLRGRL